MAQDLSQKKQVDKKYYQSLKYGSLERFVSYFYQLDSVRRTGANRVLLIGVGDGLVPYYLREVLGLEVVTCDIDPELKPSVVADIKSLPYNPGEFDAVCAFEVLEHLPWPETRQAYAELVRVSKKHIIVSVPHRRTGFELVIKFPFIRTLAKRDYLRAAVRWPVKFPGFAISGQHYWEIDGHTTTLSKFRKLINEKSQITSESTPLLDMYRRFFVIEKITPTL